MLTIDGLVTGLDTASIVEGLLSIQQAQLDRLGTQRTKVVDQQSAFKGIEAQLLTLRSQISSLGRTVNNVFDARIATSSDEDAVQASASSKATAGTLTIRVNSLAASHQLASQAFTSGQGRVTEGDFTIAVGNRAATTVTIDASNNTVDGLVNAINQSSDDVFASLVNDSSGVRILLTSKHAGADNGLQITNNLAASDPEATRPDFSGPAVQDAADAQVTIGTGPGAITVTNSTNQLDNFVEGLTLNLSSADPAKAISIVVENDTEAGKEAIEDFVSSYNDVMDFIGEQTRYDSTSENAGILQGNRTIIGIQNDIRNTIARTIGGLNSELNALGAIGLRFNDKGNLFIDHTRLDQVLNGQVPGVDNTDVKRLFALDGQSTNANINFILGSSKTKGSATPYEVDITQAAERAQVLGGRVLSGTTVISSANNKFSLSVDGDDSGNLTLTDGSYTNEELALHVQGVINSSSELSGQSVQVTVVAGTLQITSDLYGLQSELGAFTGTAWADLGFDGSENDQGQDVVGRFIVDGEIEEAIGNGRVLSGTAGNKNTADLSVRVTLKSSQVVAGSEALLTVSRGFASKLDQLIGGMVDPVTGNLKTADDGFQQRVDSFDLSIERTNELFESKREALVREFAALETAVSQLQTQSSFISSQFAALSSFSSGGGR